MRLRNVVIVLVGVFCLGVLCATNSDAATNPYYVCKVDHAGPSGTSTKVRVMLSDTADEKAFIQKSFLAEKGREKEMLAVALTAISKGYRVTAYIDLARGVITSLYLMAPQ